MRYPLIAARLFNTTLMVRPETAFVFADAFLQILAGGNVQQAAAAVPPARAAYTSRYASPRFRSKPYAMTEKGIAMLPVYGPLVQRMGELTPDCTEMTSYEWLSAKYDAMQADPEVHGIVMELDSPGGHVAGNFELARRILNSRGKGKPVYAHANEAAYSAAYSIGAGASRLFTSDTGGVGSIGVMFLHMSYAERDAKLGYKYTALYRGARKNDFNPHEPLTDEARAVADALLDRDYEIFLAHVAAARGIEMDAVRATEAALMDPDIAKAGGFIDGILTFEETLRQLEDDIGGNQSSFISGPRTSATASPPAALSKEIEMLTQADLDKARAEGLATGKEEGKKEAKSEHDKEKTAATAEAPADPAIARKAERERITAIQSSEEAKERPAAAANVAMNTDMEVEAAKKFLAGLPKETAAAGSQFGKVMSGLNARVAADPGAAGDPHAPGAAISASEIYARRAEQVARLRGLH